MRVFWEGHVSGRKKNIFKRKRKCDILQLCKENRGYPVDK